MLNYLPMLQIEINSSASFLAAAGAVLAKNNALIEILMDLRIVDDGCVKPKIGALMNDGPTTLVESARYDILVFNLP